MPNYYKLIGVERALPLTYVNSLAFENSCGSASSTHFAFPETAEKPLCLPWPSLCIQLWAHFLLLVFNFFFHFWKKLIHIHGKDVQTMQKENTMKSKLPNGGQPSVPHPPLQN